MNMIGLHKFDYYDMTNIDLFNGPVISGVFSDNSFGKAGAIQPIMQPWPTIIKLAEKKLKFFFVQS